MPDVRYLFNASFRADRGPVLLRWLLEHGADEFSVTVMALQDVPASVADAFEDALGAFERPASVRRALTSPSLPDDIREVRLWALSAESLTRLLAFFPDGLFHSPVGPDGWFEDLTVYRQGELLFGLVSHEGEGVLRLTSAEHASVAALGVISETTAESIGY
jgi:hypothetical protein